MIKRYMFGMVVAGVLGAFAASGTGSVFNDCVYWFCGGRDSSGDGFLQSGELLDTMHANDTSHNAHTCTLYGWSRVSGQTSRGVQLREEDVYCPAQGVTNRTLCLYLPQSQIVARGKAPIATILNQTYAGKMRLHESHRVVSRGIVGHNNLSQVWITIGNDIGKKLFEELLPVVVQYDDGNFHATSFWGL